jgi:hypothetical protein
MCALWSVLHQQTPASIKEEKNSSEFGHHKRTYRQAKNDHDFIAAKAIALTGSESLL